jgi:hypothetical protein
VLFLYIEDFAYGRYMSEFMVEHGCEPRKKEVKGGEGGGEVKVKPSGDTPGGFVVYRQTTELVQMLNRGGPSILDG